MTSEPAAILSREITAMLSPYRQCFPIQLLDRPIMAFKPWECLSRASLAMNWGTIPGATSG